MVIFSRCTILVQQWKVNGQWQKTIIKNSEVINIQRRGKILKCIYIFRESKTKPVRIEVSEHIAPECLWILDRFYVFREGGGG